MLTNPDLNIGSHLKDIHLTLGELAPLSLLEALLGKACEINPVKGLHFVTEGFEDTAHNAVLAGVNLNSELAVVVCVDVLELVSTDFSVTEEHS